MIQRYLGNKNSLTEYIIREIDRFCKPGEVICDIFSGTVSMSMALKANGYCVISNDISHFSYHFANSYLKNNTVPDFDLLSLGIADINDKMITAKIEGVKENDGFLFLRDEGNLMKYRKIVSILWYLENIDNKIAKIIKDTIELLK